MRFLPNTAPALPTSLRELMTREKVIIAVLSVRDFERLAERLGVLANDIVSLRMRDTTVIRGESFHESYAVVDCSGLPIVQYL